MNSTSLFCPCLSDADFGEMSSNIYFETSGQQCVNITVEMDQLLESREQFIAVLRTQDSAVKLGQSSAVIMIADSNSKSISVQNSDYSV